AIHGEDTIGNDDLETRAFRIGLLQLLFQIGHVVVGVAVARGLAEAHAIDDAGMVERIADDRILIIQQRLEYTAVGTETCRVEYGILRTVEIGDLLFKLLVYVLCTADEAYAGHAVAMAVQVLVGGLHHIGM